MVVVLAIVNVNCLPGLTGVFDGATPVETAVPAARVVAFCIV